MYPTPEQLFRIGDPQQCSLYIFHQAVCLCVTMSDILINRSIDSLYRYIYNLKNFLHEALYRNKSVRPYVTRLSVGVS